MEQAGGSQPVELQPSACDLAGTSPLFMTQTPAVGGGRCLSLKSLSVVLRCVLIILYFHLRAESFLFQIRKGLPVGLGCGGDTRRKLRPWAGHLSSLSRPRCLPCKASMRSVSISQPCEDPAKCCV